MMLSRVAEHIYWMSRYIERAESTARLISVNAFLLLDLPRGLVPEWEPLIYITGSEVDYAALHDEFSERTVVRYLIGTATNPGSILQSLKSARENCRSVRDALPRAVWEELTELYEYAHENMQSGLTKKGRHTYLKHIIRSTQLIAGTLNSTMTRNAAFSFGCIGHHLERADMTTRIIDVRTATLLPEQATELRPFETIQWVSVLNSLDAYLMYRKSRQAQVTRSEVLRFLIQDPLFPRSFLFSVHSLKDGISRLPNNSILLSSLKKLEKQARRAQVHALKHVELHNYLDELQQCLDEIHNQICETYFLHLPESEELRVAN
jgi:uncharacterized alpha-E superfamily protein